MHVLIGYFFAFGCAIVVIFSDVLIKLGADRGHTVASPFIVAGCALYAISALGWFVAMRHIPLGQAAVAYTMFSLLALCATGAVFFGEPLEWRELAGICCALAAILLMVRFA